MSHINRLLSNEDIRVKVYTAVGLDATAGLPSFGRELIYGALSDMVHVRHMQQVFLSADLGNNYKTFFRAICANVDLAVTEYTDVRAHAGERAQQARALRLSGGGHAQSALLGPGQEGEAKPGF